MKYILIFGLWMGGVVMAEQRKHYDGIRFYNEDNIEEHGLSDVFRWMLQGGKKKWPDYVKNKIQKEIPAQVEAEKINISFINHATFLIRIGGYTIITDPMYSERASPVSFAGPKRVRQPGVPFDKLPHIDFVIISHNHYDHLDLPTLRDLNSTFHPRFFVPLGNKSLLEEEGIQNVMEMDWWQSFKINAEDEIQLVPCQHWSARGIFDRFKTLWGAYFLKIRNKKILFVGDAGYSSSFKHVYENVGAVDLSILPIGAYEPRWFMKIFHMNPEEAVQAHLDLHSKQSIGSHFGTFQLTNEGIEDPPKELLESLFKKGLDPKTFLVPEPGQSFVFP